MTALLQQEQARRNYWMSWGAAAWATWGLLLYLIAHISPVAALAITVIAPPTYYVFGKWAWNRTSEAKLSTTMFILHVLMTIPVIAVVMWRVYVWDKRSNPDTGFLVG